MARESKTGGRAATTGVIPGKFALSVGMPDLPTPDGWEWILLTDVARLESGHTPSRKHPEYWDGNIPWIGIKDATENHGRTIYDTYQHTNELGIQNSAARVLPKNTVCLSRTASVGYVIVMGKPMATSQDFVNWVCSERLNHEYLKYILLAERSSLSQFSSGTVHQTIYFPEVKAFHICIPPRREQDEIVSILRSFEDKIEANRQQNQDIEALARLTYKEWFVDFGPVHALSSGESPSYMSNELASLFPTAFGDDDVPLGWRKGQLSEIASTAGRTIDPTAVDPETPYIGLEHMPRRSIALSEWEDAGKVTSNKSTFNEGDFLFGKLRPYFHKVGIAPVDGVCSTDIVVLRANVPVWHSYVLSCIFSDRFVDYTNQGSTGTKMPRTSWKEMGRYEIAIPSTEVANLYDDQFRPLFDKVVSNVRENYLLTKMIDRLLPRLLSGEIRLRDAERAMEVLV